jgi:hypothetical protein
VIKLLFFEHDRILRFEHPLYKCLYVSWTFWSCSTCRSVQKATQLATAMRSKQVFLVATLADSIKYEPDVTLASFHTIY